MDQTELLLRESKSLPFFLKAVSILIMVTGIIGFVFYASAIFYYISVQEIIVDMRYNNFSGTAYYFILILETGLNLGLIVSAIMLLNRRLSGLYIFAVTYLVFSILSYFLQSDYGWTVPIVGLVVFIIIVLHKKMLKH